jgi:ATP-dependent DNA helicase RecG
MPISRAARPRRTAPAPAAAPAAASPPRAPRSASGPQQALARLGLVRDIDLALHLPLRWEDETRLVPIDALRDGDTGQVEGTVVTSQVQFRPRRQLVVRMRDPSGDLVLRFLHFWPSHQKALAPGARVRVRGEARGGFFGREMVHPAFKPVREGAPLATALTPVYPTVAQLPQAYLRKAIESALERADLEEIVPPELVPRGLPGLREALDALHHPPPETPAATLEDRGQPAWRRLQFEELLAQQLSQLEAKRARAGERAPALEPKAGGLEQQLRKRLPFSLTAAQRRVVAEIEADLARATPMHRLLQGDVGSGKTVVAALAAAVAIDAGWQCALMAPTEILAEQHLRKLVGWLAPLGVEVAWLTGSRTGKARERMLQAVESGRAALVVGTHAVIQEQVTFAHLGLAIIDEQHRFGVQQRLALRDKLTAQAIEPHTLMMSATPIPRTLAMTLFADLDISTIDELPPGRTPIVTKLFADAKREQVIGRIRDEVAHGRQAYWVCPLIEESAADERTAATPRRGPAGAELQNAVATHAELTAALPGHAVGLVHGRLRASEKAAVMARFAAGDVAVLVATTVIEVGVDVPNASLMVIEHAERFGLAQLHQLRGRVGRGSVASVCVLLYAPPVSETAKARLKALLETNDGFEIARRDLDIRGPGEFLGARQSGAALLRFADLTLDADLVGAARASALALLERAPGTARRHVERWLGGRADFRKA